MMHKYGDFTGLLTDPVAGPAIDTISNMELKTMSNMEPNSSSNDQIMKNIFTELNRIRLVACELHQMADKAETPGQTATILQMAANAGEQYIRTAFQVMDEVSERDRYDDDDDDWGLDQESSQDYVPCVEMGNPCPEDCARLETCPYSDHNEG